PARSDGDAEPARSRRGELREARAALPRSGVKRSPAASRGRPTERGRRAKSPKSSKPRTSSESSKLRAAIVPAQPSAPGDGAYRRIYAIVRRIPRGRVATYGQIAELAGLAGHARQVGYALSALGSRSKAHADVPWQRVVNARGEVSLRAEVGWDEIQRSLLEDEGVEVD